MAEYTTPVTTTFEMQRAAIKQGQQALEQSVEFQQNVSEAFLDSLESQQSAQARTVENTMYVVHACTVGSLPMVPAVAMNYGLASILTPSDYPFARDGIAAEGTINQEQLVIADIGLDTIKRAREDGTVLPLRDSLTTKEVTSRLEQVKL